MKDLYTFDASLEEAERTYEQVRSAYSRILKKILGSGKGAWKVVSLDRLNSSPSSLFSNLFFDSQSNLFLFLASFFTFAFDLILDRQKLILVR